MPYGLQFQINNNLHPLLWILLSGDVAVNPGPGSKYFLCLSFNAQSIRSTTKLPDGTYNDAHSHHPSLCSDLPSGLRITQWNLRSLAPRINNTKLDEIKLILKDPGSETHILGVTESWLDESIDDTRIKINGYTHERSDRSSKTIPIDKQHAGGIIVYIKEDIPYFRRNDLESINVESIWLQLCPPNSRAHLICVAYRCPEYTISKWIENFEMQLNNAYVEGHQLTIMGDFNIDVSKNTSDSQQCWLESMGDLHLHQIVTESTRVTENIHLHS